MGRYRPVDILPTFYPRTGIPLAVLRCPATGTVKRDGTGPFSRNAARKLMGVANTALALDLDEPETLSRPSKTLDGGGQSSSETQVGGGPSFSAVLRGPF